MSSCGSTEYGLRRICCSRCRITLGSTRCLGRSKLAKCHRLTCLFSFSKVSSLLSVDPQTLGPRALWRIRGLVTRRLSVHPFAHPIGLSRPGKWTLQGMSISAIISTKSSNMPVVKRRRLWLAVSWNRINIKQEPGRLHGVELEFARLDAENLFLAPKLFVLMK